jgi:putative ABC transport system substrate-binding protein
MRRRDFMTLLGGAIAWPHAARAQQPATPVVGFLSGRSPASDAHLVAAFRRGLSETGHVEGRNVAIEFRWAEEQFDRLSTLAADLVRRRVAVIFAGGVDVRVAAVRAASSTIPLVIATGGDPVRLGLVTSLNRPGANVTGVTVLAASLWPKQLALLREMVAPASAIGLLVNPDNATAAASVAEVQLAARDIGQKILFLNARTESDIDLAFETLVRQRVSGLLVAIDALFINQREKIVALAARHAVPAIYGRREFAAAGGFLSYGASAIDQYYQAGLYAGRILNGAKPADLPFLQPTRFELIINLKTAKALGLAIPDRALALADDVIE